MSENDFSKKLKELRAMHGLTLEQIAVQVGVGKSTVRKWECGMIENIRRDKIANLAAALHTTPEYLMGWEKEENQQPSPTLQNINGILQKLNPDQLAQAEAFLLFLEQSGK